MWVFYQARAPTETQSEARHPAWTFHHEALLCPQHEVSSATCVGLLFEGTEAEPLTQLGSRGAQSIGATAQPSGCWRPQDRIATLKRPRIAARALRHFNSSLRNVRAAASLSIPIVPLCAGAVLRDQGREVATFLDATEGPQQNVLEPARYVLEAFHSWQGHGTDGWHPMEVRGDPVRTVQGLPPVGVVYEKGIELGHVHTAPGVPAVRSQAARSDA